MTVDEKNRVERLEETIITLDTAFEEGEDCINPINGEIVSDNEYDTLKKELEALCPESKIFKTVTAAKSEITGERIFHSPPMTSINKCNGTEEEKNDILNKFFEDCKKVNTNTEFTMSYKMDGLALSCEYENGELKRVGLRSKSGTDGINVIGKAKYIAGIPQTLTRPITCKVRGEVYTPISTFKKVNDTLSEKDQKSNARAYTAGSMNRKTAEKMKNRGLRFTAYNVVDIKNPPYKTEIERAKWTSKLGFYFVKTIPFDYNMLKTFEDHHRRLDWMVDGCVISVSNLEMQEKMGRSGDKDTGNSRGKVAWKFKDEIKEITVTSIEWQVGRDVLTPVLNFDGVSLEGTIVKKCSAHNLAIIENGKIGIGSIIGIIKSGKIIPKIKYIKEAKGKVEYPLFCPACKSPTKRVEGNNNTISLICDNPNCLSRKVKSLNHYLKYIGVKGIAESTISKLCKNGIVSKPSDFYKLTLDKIKAIGIKERSATLILARIKMINAPEQEKDNLVLLTLLDENKKIPVKMETFISSLGIDQAGRELGRILANTYNDLKDVRNLSETELETHDGIGPITASAVCKYFNNNSDEIDELLKFIEIKNVEKSTGGLEGKSFCLSGSLDKGKSFWKKEIESRGGIIKGSVSKKISYLIAGDGSGSKSDKAASLGIPILTEEDLEKMLSN